MSEFYTYSLRISFIFKDNSLIEEFMNYGSRSFDGRVVPVTQKSKVFENVKSGEELLAVLKEGHEQNSYEFFNTYWEHRTENVAKVMSVKSFDNIRKIILHERQACDIDYSENIYDYVISSENNKYILEEEKDVVIGQGKIGDRFTYELIDDVNSDFYADLCEDSQIKLIPDFKYNITLNGHKIKIMFNTDMMVKKLLKKYDFAFDNTKKGFVVYDMLKALGVDGYLTDRYTNSEGVTYMLDEYRILPNCPELMPNQIKHRLSIFIKIINILKQKQIVKEIIDDYITKTKNGLLYAKKTVSIATLLCLDDSSKIVKLCVVVKDGETVSFELKEEKIKYSDFSVLDDVIVEADFRMTEGGVQFRRHV